MIVVTGRMVMGDEEDAATAEMEWGKVLKGFEHQEDPSMVRVISRSLFS